MDVMMETLSFDELLMSADQAARQGDWQKTLAMLEQAGQIDPGHTGVLTGIGTCLIQLERPDEALPCFQKAAELAPDSSEARNNLGVIYSLTGRTEEALLAYQQAVELDPDHFQAWKNLSLVLLKLGRYLEGAQVLAAVVQANPTDAEALFLLGQCYEEAREYGSARLLYREVLKIQPDFPGVGDALQRLGQSLERLPPTDPSHIARPEHAKKLASLKSLKQNLPQSLPKSRPEVQKPRPASFAFFGPPEVGTEMRLGPVARALADSGASVKAGLSLVPADLDRYEVFVFSRPQTSTDLVSGLRACLQAGKRTVIDLDEDFHNLPHEHPKYALFGSQGSLRLLEDLLAHAGLLTVPSRLLAERYAKFARRVEIIPNTWSGNGSLWNKPAPRRQTINIGLLGAHTHPRDIFLLKKDLARLLKEFPQALLAIGQNLELYEAFSSIPEDRRLFFPDARLEDYPYLIANFDLLLLPLRDNAYNQSRSDLPLLEAGIRRIPWVGSSIPAFKEWGAGGLFAEKAGDWYGAVKRLLEESELRQELGQAGREKAEGRQVERYLSRWQAVLTGC